MLTILLFLFLLGIITKSDMAASYASMGLRIWYQSMIPALFPFMVLSGIFIKTQKAEKISPVCYVVFIGFLCGFPMGARTIAQLYSMGRLSKEECRWLLSFCNNIGPAYMTGLVIPLLHVKYPVLCLLGFYGIPFLYGIVRYYFLRRRNLIPNVNTPLLQNETFFRKNLLAAMEEAIADSVRGILNLGGYLILFCLFNLLPDWLFGRSLPMLSPFWEITSGLQFLQGRHPVYCLTMLTFGGLSCLAQTASSLAGSDLSAHIGEYTLHKTILSFGVFLYFASIQLILPGFFKG